MLFGIYRSNNRLSALSLLVEITLIDLLMLKQYWFPKINQFFSLVMCSAGLFVNIMFGPFASNWPFSHNKLVWFRYQGYAGVLKWGGGYSFYFCFWKFTYKIGVPLLRVLVCLHLESHVGLVFSLLKEFKLLILCLCLLQNYTHFFPLIKFFHLYFVWNSSISHKCQIY